VRNERDAAYEKPMADYNFEHSGVKTVFYEARKTLKDVSSRRVRALLTEGGDPSPLLPEEIAQELCEKWQLFAHKDV